MQKCPYIDYPANVAVLFTMHAENNQSRSPAEKLGKRRTPVSKYEKVFNRYMSMSGISPDDIFVVESSGVLGNMTLEDGNGLPFNQTLSYNQRLVECGRNAVGSTPLERCAVLTAINHFKKLQNYDVILKVTGKYYLPDLKKMLDCIPADTEAVMQHIQGATVLVKRSTSKVRAGPAHQNLSDKQTAIFTEPNGRRQLRLNETHTEVYGLRPRLMKQFLNELPGVDSGVTLENFYFEFLQSDLIGDSRLFLLPEIKLEEPVRRYSGDLMRSVLDIASIEKKKDTT